MEAQKLRETVQEMTREEMAAARDSLEANWNESKRPQMNLLNLACIKKFGCTISTL